MNEIARSMLASHSLNSGALSHRQPMSEHDKLVKNTQKWVAQTFYGTMLKEMRKSPWRSEEMEGGRGGEAFEEMFDQRIADHMSQAAGSPLVNSIVNRIEAKRHLRSPKLIRDAKSAYAISMRQGKNKHHQNDPRAEPLRTGDIPWNRGRAAPPQKSTKLPTQPLGHRREEKIMPEIYHVAPIK